MLPNENYYKEVSAISNIPVELLNLKRHAEPIFYHRELTGIEITEHEAVNKVVVFIPEEMHTLPRLM